MSDWSRAIEFRGKPAMLWHDGDGNWWIHLDEDPDNSIEDFTDKELDYWAECVYEWRRE